VAYLQKAAGRVRRAGADGERPSPATLSMALELAKFKALTLDCYGTLVDWERGLLAVLRGWAERNQLAAGDEELLGAFAASETRQQQAQPFRTYRQVLRAVQTDIAARFGRPARLEDAEALAHSVGDWPPFLDTTAALRQLQGHYKLVVISNVDHASFVRTQTRLGVAFDAVVTAEDVGAYKPDPRMFLRALEVMALWGIARSEVLHVAQSLFHDHAPAKRLGLATVWVDRRHGRVGWGATPPPTQQVTPDLVVPDLASLAALVAQAARG